MDGHPASENVKTRSASRPIRKARQNVEKVIEHSDPRSEAALDRLFVKAFGTGKPLVSKESHLDELAQFMTSQGGMVDSTIPAGYTYLAQFITHDITLNSRSRRVPWTNIGPSKNERTPFCDLEVIYGFDKPLEPGAPSRSDLLETKSRLKIGWTEGDGTGGLYGRSFPNDLPRENGSSKAILIDQRNEDNLLVAQIHVAFIRFHNAIADHLGDDNTTATFEKARRIAIRHYQSIILNDFLPKIVKEEVLKDVTDNSNKFYSPDVERPRLPFEFSFAAFRFGHSMIRNAYQWNRIFNNDNTSPKAMLSDLIKFTHKGGGIEHYKKLQSAWAINWNWFFDIDDSIKTQKNRFNFARRIDTLITPSLGLMRNTSGEYMRKGSLAALDLFRVDSLGLCSGQTYAKRMKKKVKNLNVLSPEQLDLLLDPDELKIAFRENTPLWFYILAEAQIEGKGTLGDVGSYIMAETFIELLKLSPFSIMNEKWEKDEFLGADESKGYSMSEMLKFIAETDKAFLNPTESV